MLQRSHQHYRSHTRTGLLGHFKATSLEISRKGAKVSQLQELPSSQDAWIALVWESSQPATLLVGSNQTVLVYHPLHLPQDYSLIRPSASFLKGQKKKADDEKKGNMISLKTVCNFQHKLPSL